MDQRRIQRAASLIRRAGASRMRFHDMRHRHATILLRAGRNPKEVSERLGHSSVPIMLQTYADVLPDRRVESAEVMARVMDAGSARPTVTSRGRSPERPRRRASEGRAEGALVSAAPPHLFWLGEAAILQAAFHVLSRGITGRGRAS